MASWRITWRGLTGWTNCAKIIIIITTIIVIIIITGRLDELCKHCLFNFHWLHAKLSAEPLAALLTDFADAIVHIKEEEKVRQVQLVADCLRLGGSLLSSPPAMLGPQLPARLLPLLPSSPLLFFLSLHHPA